MIQIDIKKRMMFVLEEDYYFITIKLLTILSGLECNKKTFVDYRKLSLIFEIIKDNKNMELLNKIINKKDLDLFDNEQLLKLFCNSNMNISVFKRILFFLEKQDIVILEKNNRFSCIDVKLLHNEAINDLLKQEIMSDDFKRVKIINKFISRICSLKFESLQTKIFGYSEVSKWED